MERVVALCARAAEGAEVLVVAGMWPEPGMVHGSRVNALMLKALDAEIVRVGSPRGETPSELAHAMAIAARGLGAFAGDGAVSCVLSRVARRPAVHAGGESRSLSFESAEEAEVPPGNVDAYRAALEAERLRPIGDILVAASLAVLNGVPLAGLLLTGGVQPEDHVFKPCESALGTGLPVLAVEDGSYAAANAVAGMNLQIPADDEVRVERVMTAVADRIDPAWARSLASRSRPPRLSPPAFRHRLVEAAREARKRIVLPEGAEPHTVMAASMVERRGIARCVLLGDPSEIREVARRQGATLPPSVEIVDPARAAPRYVGPLMDRRRGKGMTPDQAARELADPIVVGTMMTAPVEGRGPRDRVRLPRPQRRQRDLQRGPAQRERGEHRPHVAGAREAREWPQPRVPLVEDIVFTVARTAIQAQQADRQRPLQPVGVTLLPLCRGAGWRGRWHDRAWSASVDSRWIRGAAKCREGENRSPFPARCLRHPGGGRRRPLWLALRGGTWAGAIAPGRRRALRPSSSLQGVISRRRVRRRARVGARRRRRRTGTYREYVRILDRRVARARLWPWRTRPPGRRSSACPIRPHARRRSSAPRTRAATQARPTASRRPCCWSRATGACGASTTTRASSSRPARGGTAGAAARVRSPRRRRAPARGATRRASCGRRERATSASAPPIEGGPRARHDRLFACPRAFAAADLAGARPLAPRSG